jgi:hypothetical protein
MSEMTIDSTLGARFSGLSETTAIRDESGRVLGFFVPAADAGSLLSVTDGCPYTKEELNHFQQETGGRRLSEIWQSLSQSN